MTAPDPALVLVGPPHHGVVRYARDLADAVRESGGTNLVLSVPDGDAAGRLAADLDRVHLHVTDRLFGGNLEQAADRVDDIARVTKLSITLHDLPQPSDGTNFDRRRRAYARFIDAASGVVVNSRHESELVSLHLDRSANGTEVIPLGARSAPVVAASPQPVDGATLSNPPPLRVLIGGYIYPGKGHWEAISAVGALMKRLAGTDVMPPSAAVVAIGSPSVGHESDIAALHRHAADNGVEFRVTGFLDDDAYRAHMLSFGIPVAAHQHVSASRSMIDWIELRRNPLVADSAYTREMSRIRPATMTFFSPPDLADHLEAAWRDPGLTYIASETSVVPTLDDAARAYRSWWAGMCW